MCNSIVPIEIRQCLHSYISIYIVLVYTTYPYLYHPMFIIYLYTWAHAALFQINHTY